MSVMELGHLLTRSSLTYLEVSSEVCHDSFCQLGNSVSLSWVVCHEAFCLHVVSSSSCIPAFKLNKSDGQNHSLHYSLMYGTNIVLMRTPELSFYVAVSGVIDSGVSRTELAPRVI